MMGKPPGFVKSSILLDYTAKSLRSQVSVLCKDLYSHSGLNTVTTNYFIVFYCCGPIFIIFIEFVTLLLLFLCFWPQSMRNLSSLTRDHPAPPAMEGEVLITTPPGKSHHSIINHWIYEQLYDKLGLRIRNKFISCRTPSITPHPQAGQDASLSYKCQGHYNIKSQNIGVSLCGHMLIACDLYEWQH